jgi:hypothetical protein
MFMEVGMSVPVSRKLTRWALRTALSGAVASVLSSVVVALCSARETGRPVAGVNAASQWVWGRRAKRRMGPSWRYTAVGYAVHHLSSMLWSGVYEYWNHRAKTRGLAGAAGRAAVIGAVACTVDYTVTPRRLRPGFERHIPKTSIAAVYASFALGLLLAHGMNSARRHR